jgi:hypothetical protein
MVQAQGGTAQAERPGSGNSASAAPAVALPKGGGAIRGMSEKFAANPVTGTGSTTVPIITSPGRVGFRSQLSLAYDSNASNAPFGFGRGISLPLITREVGKGLPRYRDDEKSDDFILSGAEDSVPVYLQNADGNSVRESDLRNKKPLSIWPPAACHRIRRIKHRSGEYSADALQGSRLRESP